MPKPLPAPAKVNPRGIPQAPFLDKVGDFASDADDAAKLLAELREQLQKYQFMEMTTQNRIAGLVDKMPDIEKSLETTNFLKERQEPFKTYYELNDTVYAKAEVPPTQTVFLWLGANVMLEYPIDEALELLDSKVKGAQKSLTSCQEDLEFLRENITTMEVNIARVINWQITKRKENT